jgi:phospholipid/cholesterol/gamma-HCH transport system permease protein
MIDFKIQTSKNNQIDIDIIGSWDKTHLNDIIKKVKNFVSKTSNSTINLDFKNLNNIDSSGMIFLLKKIYILKNNNCTINTINLSSKAKKLYNFYQDKIVFEKIKKPTQPSILYRIGKNTTSFLKNSTSFITFLGQTVFFMIYAFLHPSKIRYKAITQQIQSTGINALGIIGLTVFLVGLVLAYQGAEQLEKFGANIFIVEMVSMSLFRELAPMIAAIVIAGRSASSFTAQIGTMKITDEIDAMKTMGFEPSIFLVMPRVLALVIVMPLLVFFSDFFGLVGGMLVANYQLDISYAEFINRMYLEVDIKHLIIGLVKAPVFGIVIALIGCYRGFQVTGSTSSIGKYTTISVVNAIFWVIALNAIISVVLTQVGI